MHIGILAAGVPPEPLIHAHGTFGQMFQRLLGDAGLEFEFSTYAVQQGRFPASSGACDGWLITGSKCAVYDNLPWMQRLKALACEIHATGRPLVGICFGHQLVAEAFGGRVEKYAGGWGVGLHRYTLSDPNPWVRNNFSLCAMHQDQVVEKPPSAHVLARSAFCEYAALGYGEHCLTLQAHPEFTLSFERALLQAREGDPIPKAQARAGLASVTAAEAATDALAVARWMGAVLQGAAPAGGKRNRS